MAVKLSPQSIEALEAFASGRMAAREFARWLTVAAYDDDLSEQERDELARVDLLLHESLEGLRPASEALAVAEELLSLAAAETQRRSA